MRNKTYKRETAWVMLIFLGYIAFKGSVDLVEVLVWPIFLFTGASYGMDWATKQTNLVEKVNEAKK